MKTKLTGLLSLVLLTSVVYAADPAPAPASDVNLWTLSLGGGGATTTTGDSQSTFGLDLSLGRTGSINLLGDRGIEYGLRQSVNYDSHDGGGVVLDTSGYLDVNVVKLLQDKLDVFAGANLGLTYGDIKPEWHIAPEAGVRYWFIPNVAVLGRVSYGYDLTHGRLDDLLGYFLGLEARF